MIKILAKTTDALNRNTGYLILLTIVVFGLISYGVMSDTRQAVKNTETIVAKQDETLEAIKAATEDNRLTAEQKANLIICMLQVPVLQRTPDTVTNCRKQVEESQVHNLTSPDGTNNNAVTTPTPAQSIASADEPSTPPANPEPEDNEGIVIDLPILPPIRIPSPL